MIVLVAVTGGNNKKASSASGFPPVEPVDANVLHTLENIPQSTWTAVGTGSSQVVPGAFTVKSGQEPLTIDGKPGAVFVGALFCPLCGADRWAMVTALSRFGTFTGLQQTTSSPVDSDPSTVTFDFQKATFSSPYFAFEPAEHYGNDTYQEQVRAINQPLTPLQSHLYSKYGQVGSVPFFDIGNKVFVQTAMYDPGLLAGLTWSQVAAKLSNPNDPVTQAIVGAANNITAAICSVNNHQPTSVCSNAGVKKAAASLGLS